MSADTDVTSVPMPITAGVEMAALARFHRDMTWSGTIAEGGMGPGAPAMTATGRGTHHTIQDGRWIVGDYEQDQYLADGTFVLRWQLHWVAGWDPVVGEYTATHADNYGRAGLMYGRIEGDLLVFESPADSPVRIRMTWDDRQDHLVWRNELAAPGEPWQLVEEYDCRPLRQS